jgi:hypothetical protein
LHARGAPASPYGGDAAPDAAGEVEMFNAVMRFDLGDDVEALRETVHRWGRSG